MSGPYFFFNSSRNARSFEFNFELLRMLTMAHTSIKNHNMVRAIFQIVTSPMHLRKEPTDQQAGTRKNIKCFLASILYCSILLYASRPSIRSLEDVIIFLLLRNS